MALLYLVRDANSLNPHALCASGKEADERAREIDNPEIDNPEIDNPEIDNPEIDVEDVQMTRAGVCEFITREFGVAIFEN